VAAAEHRTNRRRRPETNSAPSVEPFRHFIPQRALGAYRAHRFVQSSRS